MVITGIDDINRMLAQGHSCVCYMGHFFNWEYVTSFSLYFNDENVVVGDIYHPLENSYFDRLMKKHPFKNRRTDEREAFHQR